MLQSKQYIATDNAETEGRIQLSSLKQTLQRFAKTEYSATFLAFSFKFWKLSLYFIKSVLVYT